jgi:DNA polymerase III epsilon subunit-like protein
MIFLDCESTGLIMNEGLPLKDQPSVIDIGCVRTNSIGETLDELTTLVQPAGFKALPEVITVITGLQDEQVAGAPLFIEIYGALCAFFLGEAELVAHNASFDLMMLVFELRRVGKEFAFPYPPQVTDTLATMWQGKLADWGKAVRGANSVQEHRALSDARLLRDCYFSGITK